MSELYSWVTSQNDYKTENTMSELYSWVTSRTFHCTDYEKKTQCQNYNSWVTSRTPFTAHNYEKENTMSEL